MRPIRANPDRCAAAFAARRHGVITIGQLLSCGLSRDAVKRRVHAGRLHRLFRGVDAVGHPGLSNEGRWLAAVLACGEGAVLSDRSAAEHLGLPKPLSLPIHVTVAGDDGRRKRSGVIVHRSSSLTRGEVGVKDAIAGELTGADAP